MKKVYQFCQILCAIFLVFFFATNANAQIVVTNDNPYTESFENGGLASWSNTDVVGSDEWVDSYAVSHTGTKCVNYSSSLFGDFLDIQDNPLAILSFFNNMANFGNGSARLVSPTLDLSGLGGQVTLRFYRKQSTMMIAQTLSVYYRTSPSAAWTFLQQYTGATDWSEETLTLPNISSTYQVSFMGNFNVDNMGSDPTSLMSMFTDPNAATNMASDIYIDDIFIGVTVPCNAPQNLAMSNVTSTSATATWSGTATNWTVEIGPAGFSHGSGTTYTAQNPTYTFTNLTPNASYDVYVRANCAGDVTSNWAQTSFTATPGSGIAENGYGFLSVSPNPTTGVVRCTMENLVPNTRLQVLDVYGKLLMEQPVTEATTELDFTDKAAGLYFLRVVSDNKVVTTQKVIRR